MIYYKYGILPIHNYYKKYHKKYYDYNIKRDDKFAFMFYPPDDYDEPHGKAKEIYDNSMYYRFLASNNFMIPSLYYKCFLIKNLNLTSYEHMLILKPLHNKIYCVYLKIKYLYDSKYLIINSKKGIDKYISPKKNECEFINEKIKEKFITLYNDYFF